MMAVTLVAAAVVAGGLGGHAARSPLGSPGSSCAELLALGAPSTPWSVGCTLSVPPLDPAHGLRPDGHHGVGFGDDIVMALTLNGSSIPGGGGGGGACSVLLRHDGAAPHGVMKHGGHHASHGHLAVDVGHYRWLVGAIDGGGTARVRMDLSALASGSDSAAAPPGHLRSHCMGASGMLTVPGGPTLYLADPDPGAPSSTVVITTRPGAEEPDEAEAQRTTASCGNRPEDEIEGGRQRRGYYNLPPEPGHTACTVFFDATPSFFEHHRGACPPATSAAECLAIQLERVTVKIIDIFIFADTAFNMNTAVGAASDLQLAGTFISVTEQLHLGYTVNGWGKPADHPGQDYPSDTALHGYSAWLLDQDCNRDGANRCAHVDGCPNPRGTGMPRSRDMCANNMLTHDDLTDCGLTFSSGLCLNQMRQYNYVGDGNSRRLPEDTCYIWNVGLSTNNHDGGLCAPDWIFHRTVAHELGHTFGARHDCCAGDECDTGFWRTRTCAARLILEDRVCCFDVILRACV